MRRLFVLAGNVSEYTHWCREHPEYWNRTVYAHSGTLCGVHFPADGRLIRIGSWAEREDLVFFEKYIEVCTFIPEGQNQIDFEFGAYE